MKQYYNSWNVSKRLAWNEFKAHVTYTIDQWLVSPSRVDTFLVERQGEQGHHQLADIIIDVLQMLIEYLVYYAALIIKKSQYSTSQGAQNKCLELAFRNPNF